MLPALLAGVIALTSATCSASAVVSIRGGQVLSGYSGLLAALQQGHRVRFVVDYDQCSPPLGPADGAGGVQTYQWFDIPEFHITERLAWSQTELITNYQGSGYAWDYVQMVALPNNTLVVTASDLNATSFAKLYEETTYCPITVNAASARAAVFSIAESQLPTQLYDYASIRAALNSNSLRVFHNYTSCPVYVGPFGKPGLNVSAATDITTIENFRGPPFAQHPFFAYSVNQLIKQSNGPGYQRDLVESRVFQNGSVILNVNVLDPLTYQVAFHEYFECFIDNGKDVSGFKFFVVGGANEPQLRGSA